jgi:signal transduction histidine kinase
MIDYIKNAFRLITKSHYKDEDKSRVEHIFNVILLSIIFLCLIHFLILPVFIFFKKDEYNGISLYYPFIIFLFYVGIFLLSKKGYLKASITILISSLIGIVLYTQILWGFDLPSSILMWSLIIVLTSILISTSTAIILSVSITTFSVLSIYLENNGLILSDRHWKTYSFTYSNTVEYGFIFISIATISWLSNKEISKSLRRARESEKALKQERDLLDQKVIEKTKKLQDAQIDKINQMYRLVEFGRLSSGLFHDISSPLTAIAMNIDNKSIGPSESFQLEKIVQSTKKMVSLIEIAKKQLKIDTLNEEFTINKEIDGVIDILSTKARRLNVSIFFNSNKKIKYFGNTTIFCHIITNLISNAIDSYEEIKDQRPRKIFIWLNKKRSVISITIKDHGAGIDNDITNKIFEPFFTTKDKNGCGIGLSATKHHLEKYFNGTITVKSRKNEGSRFEIRIPKS